MTGCSDPSGSADRLERLRGSRERQRPTGDARRTPGSVSLLSRSRSRSIAVRRRYRGLRERPGSSVVAAVKVDGGESGARGRRSGSPVESGKSSSADAFVFCAVVDHLSSFGFYISSSSSNSSSSNWQASSCGNLTERTCRVLAYLSRAGHARRSLLRPRCPRRSSSIRAVNEERGRWEAARGCWSSTFVVVALPIQLAAGEEPAYQRRRFE